MTHAELVKNIVDPMWLDESKSRILTLSITQAFQDIENEALRKVEELIGSYWHFDDHQQQLSNWHDRQDCLKAIRAMKKEEK